MPPERFKAIVTQSFVKPAEMVAGDMKLVCCGILCSLGKAVLHLFMPPESCFNCVKMCSLYLCCIFI